MGLKEELESKTVSELKQLCKERDVKGYSKLAKDGLIAALLDVGAKTTNLQDNLASHGNDIKMDPATQKMLQRTSVKKVYSRDESEARIEKNKDLLTNRSEIASVPASHVSDNEAAAQLVKATARKVVPKQKQTQGTSTASIPFLPQSAPVTGSSTITPENKAPAKLVVSSKQITKAGSNTKSEAAKKNVPDTSIKQTASAQSPIKKTIAHDIKPLERKQASTTAKGSSKNDTGSKVTNPSTSTQPTKIVPQSTKQQKMVVSAQQIQKTQPTPQRPVAEPESKGPRFQDLPGDDQRRALNNVSKNVIKILHMRKADFLKKKAKDLEKYLELLEIEKGKFTVYRPTDKALRCFMDESIAIINQVKEEQLNILEQQWFAQELPKIIKKNGEKIKKIISRIDRYYTDMDAARDIVEKLIKNKSPFPQSYLITVILQKIRDKGL